MYLFTVETFSTTASFRIPESHTFQQTLPLPPITTLVGMMGAALGLNFEDAIKYRKNNGILFGVIGLHNGEMSDLWKYNRIKKSYKEDGSDRKGILIREFLIDFKLTLAIASKNKEKLSELRESFRNPKYALSAGNSDDILKIKDISNIVEAKDEEYTDFENTILPADQTLEYESLIDLKNTPISYRVRAPQVFLLPTSFEFKGKERRVSNREQYTFVGTKIKLKNPIKSYNINKQIFVLL